MSDHLRPILVPMDARQLHATIAFYSHAIVEIDRRSPDGDIGWAEHRAELIRWIETIDDARGR